MKIEEAFGISLREIRRNKKYSQEKLALESNLDSTTISLYERGLRSPSLKTIFALALVLDINPSELVKETEKKLNENISD